MSPEAYLAALDEARQFNIYRVGHLLDELPLETIYAGGL
jgi:hypothetical protein